MTVLIQSEKRPEGRLTEVQKGRKQALENSHPPCNTK